MGLLNAGAVSMRLTRLGKKLGMVEETAVDSSMKAGEQ